MHGLSRRALLATTPAFALASIMSRMSFAATPRTPDARFVVVILRGAMDGLSAVPPVGDPDYASLRANLAIGRVGANGGALPLDGTLFGLHPAMATLLPLYAAREMLVMHAMASPYRDRSHFDGQNVIENGTTSAGSSTGWLNRLLGVMKARAWGGGGMAFGPTMPLMLQGPAAAGNWLPALDRSVDAGLLLAAGDMYATDPRLSWALSQGIKIASMDTGSGSTAPPAGTTAPAQLLRPFPYLAKSAAQVMAVDSGPNVATLEAYGWDTHAGQGTSTGRLADALNGLAEGIGLLKTGLGSRWENTVVAVVTEFGRTAAPNGTQGTDHGTATAGFAFGGAIAGGRILANWPGLSKASLYQGRDLMPTLDLRSFLKGLLGDYFKLSAAELASVFPSSTAAPSLSGLLRS